MRRQYEERHHSGVGDPQISALAPPQKPLCLGRIYVINRCALGCAQTLVAWLILRQGDRSGSSGDLEQRDGSLRCWARPPMMVKVESDKL